VNEIAAARKSWRRPTRRNERGGNTGARRDERLRNTGARHNNWLHNERLLQSGLGRQSK